MAEMISIPESDPDLTIQNALSKVALSSDLSSCRAFSQIAFKTYFVCTLEDRIEADFFIVL